MRNEYYRSLCDDPKQYDKVIDWIKVNNPYAGYNQDPENFASNAVNGLIRNVISGNHGVWASSAMCVVYRLSNNPDLPGYRKVRLAVEPL